MNPTKPPRRPAQLASCANSRPAVAWCQICLVLLVLLVWCAGCKNDDGIVYTVDWDEPKPSIVEGTLVYYMATEKAVEIGKVILVGHDEGGSHIEIAVHPSKAGKLRRGTRFFVSETTLGEVYIEAKPQSIDAEVVPKGASFQGSETPRNVPLPSLPKTPKAWVVKILIAAGVLLCLFVLYRMVRRFWPVLLAIVAGAVSATFLGGYLEKPVAELVPAFERPDLLAWAVAFIGGGLLSLILVLPFRQRHQRM